MTPKSSVGGHGAGLGLQSKFGGTSGGSGSVGSGLYHHAIGSTNSLWSRTSSKDPEKDGAKMFEIFNRNLIKTIKVSYRTLVAGLPYALTCFRPFLGREPENVRTADLCAADTEWFE